MEEEHYRHTANRHILDIRRTLDFRRNNHCYNCYNRYVKISISVIKLTLTCYNRNQVVEVAHRSHLNKKSILEVEEEEEEHHKSLAVEDE